MWDIRHENVKSKNVEHLGIVFVMKKENCKGRSKCGKLSDCIGDIPNWKKSFSRLDLNSKTLLFSRHTLQPKREQ